MKHFIPIVNRVATLLPAALSGCQSLRAVTTIIDNRDRVEEREICLNEIAGDIPVYIPSVPLTTAQTMNLMLRFANEQGVPFFTWQHLDAVCLEDTAQRLSDLAHELLVKGKPWGTLLTRSILAPPRRIDGTTYKYIATDAFAAYNTAALQSIGGWDWVRFPYYALDSDVYIRLERHGFPVLDTGLPVDHAAFSQTLREDPDRQAVIEAHWPLWRKLFNEKNRAEFWDYKLYT